MTQVDPKTEDFQNLTLILEMAKHEHLELPHGDLRNDTNQISPQRAIEFDNESRCVALKGIDKSRMKL